ncbi:S-adenosyl-L-methionine-dependent methyltransferase, partial [Suillus cothurnatus]
IDTSSRLHHGFRRHQVPYPRNYERNVLDLDAVDTLLTRQMSGGSLTWHVFPPSWNKPPPDVPLKRILDIGSGNGVWVVEAAKHWKGCEVVGLDIVSLHPDLVRLSRDKDLLKRVSWVQANFLEGLPFANESFDFVHIKRIARGVPEDKVSMCLLHHTWDDLFEEITRVMKPGAAFEIVEEDLSFPGRPDWEGSEVGTLRSKGSNISMSPSSVVPPDPRDHTVLETIYNEMHSDRWINLSPLSLLANTVGSWFKGESLSFIPSILSEEYDDGELQVRWAYISGSSKTSILVKTHSLFFCT